MMMNNKSMMNRSTRAESTTKKSTTPEYYKTQKMPRISQSQPKGPSSQINNMSILTPISEQLGGDKCFYVGKGNNAELITRILLRRKGWKEVGQTDFAHFRWIQNGLMFKYHLLGKQCLCFNHFEYQRELSNKQRLVKNMVNFCEANKMNVYNFIPVSFVLDLNTGEQDLALHAFIKFFNRNYPEQSQPKKNHSIILPRSKYLPYLSAQQLNKRSQGNFYCKPICPKSFFDDETKSYLWILKPTFLNRGRGVVLFRQLQELEKLIWKFYEGEGLEDYGEKYHNNTNNTNTSTNTTNNNTSININPPINNNTNSNDNPNTNTNPTKNDQNSSLPTQPPPTSSPSPPPPKPLPQKDPSSLLPKPRCLSFIIQKYIEKPLLINNKKFDIRVWVLLTQTLQFYIFSESYLRFSSQAYSTRDSYTNPFVHLTNNSVQKYCGQFDASNGNQFLLKSVQNYLMPKDKAKTIYQQIMVKIKEIISLTMYSVRRKININNRKNCFQLFGYDFMIDSQNKVWLIEINTNPAIEESSPLLKVLLPRMVDDMFKLTIDKIFGLKQDSKEPGSFPVEGYNDDQNMWQYLGDLKEGVSEKNGKRFTFVRR